uniref:Uncharacterized protein n=1 Tax=Nelumbo nucifera TaxID=4432 RepID=A0A822ZJQ3_NELNU|nr:TPA_asm: hypothetical protein HUJ06_001829 [Nelumbo nucifera]
MEVTSDNTHPSKQTSLVSSTEVVETLVVAIGMTKTKAPKMSPDWTVMVANRIWFARVVLELGKGILLPDDISSYDNQFTPVLSRKLI